MFEKQLLNCPVCGHEIHENKKENTDIFTCKSCNTSYNTVEDKQSGKIGLIEKDTDKPMPEPLFLPKGSIRGGLTITLSAICWIMIWRNQYVPSYLLSLILTIIGYYFGFRQKMAAADSRIYDASTTPVEPLFLPKGMIRTILITGFTVSAIVLSVQNRLTQFWVLEFYFIFLGLTIGHLIRKLTYSFKRSYTYELYNHGKGMLVIMCAIALIATLLVPEIADKIDPIIPLFLASGISFYFGSRT